MGGATTGAKEGERGSTIPKLEEKGLLAPKDLKLTGLALARKNSEDERIINFYHDATEKIKTFFTYQAMNVIDVEKDAILVRMEKKTMEECLEDYRAKVVRAMPVSASRSTRARRATRWNCGLRAT